VAETTVKRLLCCGFQCTGKAMDKISVSVLVEDMSRNRCFSPGLNITCFMFYPFVTYLLTLPRTCQYEFLG
jgi:hypothetical protein